MSKIACRNFAVALLLVVSINLTVPIAAATRSRDDGPVDTRTRIARFLHRLLHGVKGLDDGIIIPRP